MHTNEDFLSYSLDILRMKGQVANVNDGVTGFFKKERTQNRHGVTATLTVAVRDEFIMGLVVRQVDVYVTVNWWAHAMISTEWRITDY